VRSFRRTFEVQITPDKLMFSGPTGVSFSFDVSGTFHHPAHTSEVFIESKGHKDGSRLLEGYKEFLAKSYATSVSYSRHKRDLFWFLTNVPFGSTFGRNLTSAQYIYSWLTSERNEKVESLLGSSPVDFDHVTSLAKRASVCVFTDSFIRVAGISYPVKHGDSIWSITQLLHGGRIPFGDFYPIKNIVAELNKLDNPDKILAGKRLHIPWYGLEWD